MKLNTRILRHYKKSNNNGSALSMLTCYDFQMANLLNETELDLILVGDSLGNVVLGYESTVDVGLDEMIIFSKAVKKGAPDKFIIADMPFGTYGQINMAIENAVKLFQSSGVNALKLEGAEIFHLEIIERLTKIGIPVVGHIGLTPQSVNELGGHYMHGKTQSDERKLIHMAKELEAYGAFMIVLECISPLVSKKITNCLNIPTIGIGSGSSVDGQVLVINDLLGNGKDKVPKFVSPIANLYTLKKGLIENYIKELKITKMSDQDQLRNLNLPQDEKNKQPIVTTPC